MLCAIMCRGNVEQWGSICAARALRATFTVCFPGVAPAFPSLETAHTERKSLGGKHNCLVGIGGQISALRAHAMSGAPPMGAKESFPISVNKPLPKLKLWCFACRWSDSPMTTTRLAPTVWRVVGQRILDPLPTSSELLAICPGWVGFQLQGRGGQGSIEPLWTPTHSKNGSFNEMSSNQPENCRNGGKGFNQEAVVGRTGVRRGQGGGGVAVGVWGGGGTYMGVCMARSDLGLTLKRKQTR